MSALSYPDPGSGSSCPTGTPRSRGHLPLVVLAGLLWGTGGLSGALLSRITGLHPLAVAAYRLAGGGLVLLLVLAATGGLAGTRWRWSAAALRRVLAIGVLAGTYQAAYFAAVELTGVPVATLVTLGAAPVLVLLVETVAGLAHRRRPDALSVAAVGLAVGGLVLLVGAPGPVSGGALAGGVALSLLAAAGFALLTLLGRRQVPGLEPAAGVGAGFLVAGLALVVLVEVAVPAAGMAFAPSAASLGVLAYFVGVPTALAYGLFFAGLRGVSASSAAVVAVLEPLTASVLGVLLLGERMGPGAIAGAALLCAAALLASRRT
jgi:drug/metabolite transporter, DME family